MVAGKNEYEGRQENINLLQTPAIETWQFQFPGSDSLIKIEIPEFTCVCPKTALPDFATIGIDYIPDRLCLELKSLKEYILFYRDVGIFHEHVVNKILNDLTDACKPRKMEIRGIFNPRGGIQTTVTAQYSLPKNGPGQ